MFEPLRHLPDGAKHLVDGLSVATLLGAIVNLLPSLAALLTIVWTSIRILETDTMQRLLKRIRGAE